MKEMVKYERKQAKIALGEMKIYQGRTPRNRKDWTKQKRQAVSDKGKRRDERTLSYK